MTEQHALGLMIGSGCVSNPLTEINAKVANSNHNREMRSQILPLFNGARVPIVTASGLGRTHYTLATKSGNSGTYTRRSNFGRKQELAKDERLPASGRYEASCLVYKYGFSVGSLYIFICRYVRCRFAPR